MNDVPSENIQGKPDLKEIAAEMLIKHEQLGEFKDKKGLEETTDLKIGPDIRYALKSCNVDFLKRIIKGPLTVAEYREVRYRLTELEQQYVTDNSIRKGHVIDTDHSLHAIMRGKAVENEKEENNGHRSIVDVKI
ncbi:MAG: hypothetical protein SVY10_12530 [Thermodesulfobacteriota bacterium]|nr:hypothetical protein [Thermodesulfobacteriota bacterium]